MGAVVVACHAQRTLALPVHWLCTQAKQELQPYLDCVVQLAPDELALIHATLSISKAGLQAGQLDLCAGSA